MYIHLVVNLIFACGCSNEERTNKIWTMRPSLEHGRIAKPHVSTTRRSLQFLFHCTIQQRFSIPHFPQPALPSSAPLWRLALAHLHGHFFPTAAASFAARASFTLTISSYITHRFSLPYHRWLGRSASFGFVVNVRQELILIPKGARMYIQCQKVSSSRSKFATDHPLLRTHVDTWVNTARKSSEDRESSISLPKFPTLSGQHAARGKDWITWIRRGVEMR